MSLSNYKYRQAQLEAIYQATRATKDLGLASAEWVDPFAALEDAGALLMFRPLAGLCGAYIPKPVGGDVAGVFISTMFPLSVQRFTAAHELGHLWMGHATSLDTEADILPRATGSAAWRGSSQAAQEIAAEAFAAHFLMPKARVVSRMRAMDIDTSHLQHAEAVYQLSLWFGASYQAMAWHLVSLQLISAEAATALTKQRPKRIKQTVGGQDALLDWRNDVWSLTVRESGTRLHARVGDSLAIRLPSHASGGYLWNGETVDPDVWDLIRIAPDTVAMPDVRASRDTAVHGATSDHTPSRAADAAQFPVGTALEQVALLRIRQGGAHPLTLTERRPWAPASAAAEFHVDVIAQEPPLPGLSISRRQEHLRHVLEQ